MDLIEPSEVVRRIESYFEGGSHRPLTPTDLSHATRAARTTRRNGFDRQRLNLHNAGRAFERKLGDNSPCPEPLEESGIGGVRHRCDNLDRRLGMLPEVAPGGLQTPP